MVDVIETPPPAVDQSGNLTIWWASTITNPLVPKVTEVTTTEKRLTYSFTPGGWSPTRDQAIEQDARLTLATELQSLGKITQNLALEYVDSSDAKSAAVILVEGTSGYFIERRGVPNKNPLTVGDKVRVYAVTLGTQGPGGVDGTGKFNIAQKCALTNVVGGAVAMVA